jgi:hypothetical protein
MQCQRIERLYSGIKHDCGGGKCAVLVAISGEIKGES